MISLKSIENLIFALILLLDIDFMGLISPSAYSLVHNNLNRTGQIILVAVLILIQLVRKGYLHKIKFWTKFLGFAFATVAVCSIYSMMKYPQGIYDMYVMSNFWFVSLIIFPFYNNLREDKSFVKIMAGLLLLNIIVSCTQALVFNTTGRIFLRSIDAENIGMRNGLYRGGTGVAYIAPFVLMMFSKNVMSDCFGKAAKWISIIGGSAMIVFIIQTRARFLGLVIAIVCIFLVRRERVDRKFITIILLVAVGLWALRLEQVQFMIDSVFSSSSEYTSDVDTIGVRWENIAYRMSYFKYNPVFGMGIVRAVGVTLKNIALGPDWLFFSSDVGVFDTIASYGIFGIGMVAAVVGKWIAAIGRTRKSRRYRDCSWIYGIIVNYLLTMMSIGFFSENNIIPFLLFNLIIDYEINKPSEGLRI